MIDRTPEEQEKFKRELEQLLNAKINVDKNIVKRYAGYEHQCSMTGCSRAGTMAKSTIGGGIFYCPEHFKLKS